MYEIKIKNCNIMKLHVDVFHFQASLSPHKASLPPPPPPPPPPISFPHGQFCFLGGKSSFAATEICIYADNSHAWCEHDKIYFF